MNLIYTLVNSELVLFTSGVQDVDVRCLCQASVTDRRAPGSQEPILAFALALHASYVYKQRWNDAFQTILEIINTYLCILDAIYLKNGIHLLAHQMFQVWK